MDSCIRVGTQLSLRNSIPQALLLFSPAMWAPLEEISRMAEESPLTRQVTRTSLDLPLQLICSLRPVRFNLWVAQMETPSSLRSVRPVLPDSVFPASA